MGKILKIVGVLVVLLAVAVGVLLFTDFEAPRLGAKLVAIAGQAAGIDLEAENFRINLRRGLLLESVVARSEANGEIMTASLDLLEVECRLIPLIRGDIVVERIVLQSPRIEVISKAPQIGTSSDAEPAPAEKTGERTAQESAEGGAESLADRPRPVNIGELSIVDAHFISRSETPGGAVTEIADLDFQLRDFVIDDSVPSALVGTSGSGRLSASGMRFDEHELSDLSGDLTADNGQYLLSGVQASGRSGDVRIERLEVDLLQSPYRYRVAASLSDVDLNALLEGAIGAGPGRASLSLDGTGEGPGLAGAVADVVVRLEAGTLPSAPPLQSIDRLLGTSLDRAAYEATEIEVSLVDERLEIEPFEIVTEVVRLKIGGTVEIEGGITVQVGVSLPRGEFAREGVSEQVLDALTDRSDWLTIPLAVTGTLDRPRFGPDMEAIQEATRRLVGEAAEATRTRVRTELEAAIRSRLGR